MTNKMPPEVKEYFKNGTRKIINVVANDDYSLTVTFDNDEVKRYDMKDKLFGVFEILKNLDKFKEVFIDEVGAIAWDKDKSVDSSIHWNNRIDLCPDSVYIYSAPINRATMNPRVKKVKSIGNYRLLLTFTNNEKKVFDMGYWLSKPMYKELRSPKVFDTVTAHHGTVLWSNGLDMCPDELYEKSITLEEFRKKINHGINIRKIVQKSIKIKEITDKELQKHLDEIRPKWTKNPKPCNIDRINMFLNKVEDYWRTCPDLRFGQIMAILNDEARKINKDPFFLEENEWKEILETLIKEKMQEDFSKVDKTKYSKDTLKMLESGALKVTKLGTLAFTKNRNRTPLNEED